MQPPSSSSSSQLRAGTQGPRGAGWGGHAYLAETGLPGGPGAASLITAHDLLGWRRKVGVGREGGNKMDIIWTEWGGCGALPKDQREFVLDQGLRPGGGWPGKVPWMACVILTGGPALPIGLDGVALVAGGTAGRDRRWLEVLPGPPPTVACFSRPLRALAHLSQRRPV